MKISALKVKQWLDLWDQVTFDKGKLRPKPEDHFYMFTLRASDLRLLCGIYPRESSHRSRAAEDMGIQRRHEVGRSEEINQFVRFGYPWSELSDAKRNSGEYDDLKKPGWLPTAIVVNILKEDDERRGKKVAASDVIHIKGNDSGATLTLPSDFPKKNWKATSISPIEVIDGQHRLWAFDESIEDGDFELPVVAFHGLGISWQAYLFYTINIKPKRINASLAFDLYPLLRTEDWLEKFEGPAIYRETRAQELVDLLYSSKDSPWFKQINMLGESGLGKKMVSQAAWVRSLLATFVKHWEGKQIKIGGLFGAPVGSHQQVLSWSRHEQAAFLIYAGQLFQQAIKSGNAKWQKALRPKGMLFEPKEDAAFTGPNTLISQDQGIRAFLSIVNDLCYLNADKFGLNGWGDGSEQGDNDLEQIGVAIKSLKKAPISNFLHSLAESLAQFDWRASSAPGLSNEESLMKAAFRGSGGYRDLRHQLLLHLTSNDGEIGASASQAIKLLKY